MKKTLMAIVFLTVLCLVVSFVPMIAGAEATVSKYDGTASTTLRNEGNTYYIDSAADMAYFAASVNGGETYEGKTVKMTVDIVWNEGDASTWTIDTTGLQAWPSIGISGKPFKGTFDGQGHSLSGLWRKTTTWRQGIFGLVTGATIKNLVVENSSLFSTDQQNAAFISAVVDGPVTIENCYIDADYTMTNTATKWNSGGVIGVAFGNVTMKNVVYAGNVSSGSAYVGGLVGSVYADSLVFSFTDCAITGNVNGHNFVGGFIGGNTKDAGPSVTITDSMMLGTVTADNTYGAVISGQKADKYAVMNAVNLYVLDSAADEAAYTVANETVKTAAEIAALTNEALTVAGFENWSKTTDGKVMPTSVATMLGVLPSAGSSDSSTGNSTDTNSGSATDNSGTPSDTNSGSATDNTGSTTDSNAGGTSADNTPAVVNPEFKPSIDLSKASVYDGTKSEKLTAEDKTIYINSAADLALFAEKVTSGMAYAGKTVVLTTDIVWNTGNASKWVAGTETPKYTWSCGAWNKFFQGTFDGQGHVISGLYNSTDSDNIGFINGTGGTAEIKNLAIVNSAFLETRASGKSANLGGLVGIMGEKAKLTVSNVYIDVNLSTAANNVGGLVGRIHNGYCELTIENTVVAGSIKGGDNVGGFVGIDAYNNHPDKTSAPITVTNSLNLATVEGNKNVGGFVGYNENGTTTLTNCLSAGKITATDAATTGAFLGSGKQDATVTKSAYVKDVAAQATGAALQTGYSVYEAAAIVGANASSAMTDFDFRSNWTTVEGSYPIPTAVYKIVGSTTAGGVANNPNTSDFAPVAFVEMAVLAMGAAVVVCRKKAN